MLEDIAKWLIKEGRFAEAKELVKELKTVKEKNAFASRIAKYLEKAPKRKENFGMENPSEEPMEEDDFVEPLEPDFFGEPEEEFVMVDEEEPGATDPLAMDKEIDPTYEFQGDSLDAFEGGFEEEGEEEEGEFSFEDGSEVEVEDEVEIEEEDEFSFDSEEEEMTEDEYETEEEDEMEFSEEDETEMEDEEEMEEEYTSPDSFEDEVSSSYANKFEGDKGGFNQGFSEKVIDEAIKRHKQSLKKESVKPKAKPVAKKQVKESKGGMKVRKDVFKYYESAVKINPALKDVRGRILKSKSLEEAMKVSEGFVRKQGDVSVKKTKVKESFSFQPETKSGWMLGKGLL